MSARDKYETDAEIAAYYEGRATAIEVMDDLREVRKIACALIPVTNMRLAEAAGWIANEAWAIWRAIKAGQEGKP